MRRRRCRVLKPDLERFERRELLSAITDILAAPIRPIHPRNQASLTTVQASASAPGSAGSGVTLVNPNGVLTPIAPGPGELTNRELARDQFKGYFSGPFYAAPPRFTSQTKVLQLRGLGGTTQFLHGDYQMTIPLNKDPNAPITGLAYLQDRNINSAGALGLDLTFDPTSLDQLGRPTRGTFTQDPNIYSGVDFVDTATGTVTIHYSKGAATVHFQGLLYTSGVTDPLRNMDLQARGGRLVARSK